MQQPDLVIYTTGYMDRKIAAIKAYASQFYNPDSKEPQTLIASESFFDSITSRDQEMGRCIERPFAAVSYTHLTLPTILLV